MIKYRLVDIDSLLYKSAARGLETIEIQKGYFIDAFNLEKGMQNMTDILEPLNGENIKLLLFGNNINLDNRFNFRKIINPEYKANRSNLRPPVGLNLLIEKFYNSNEVQQCEYYNETDDAISYAFKGIKDRGLLAEIVSIDKDFNTLDDVLNPMTLESCKKDEMFWYKQAMQGDAADGIKGIKGMGAVAVKNAFKDINSKEEAESMLIDIYKSKKLDLLDLYRDFFCLSLNHRYDYETNSLYCNAFEVESKVNLTEKEWTIS